MKLNIIGVMLISNTAFVLSNECGTSLQVILRHFSQDRMKNNMKTIDIGTLVTIKFCLKHFCFLL